MNVDNTVLDFGFEESRFGADAFALTGEKRVFGFFVGGEVGDVVEHPAEVLVELFGREFGGRDGGAGFEEFEAGGKFAVAEAGLVEALAGAGAAGKDIEVFAFAGAAGDFRSAFVENVGRENFEVGFDDVGDIAQEGGGALLAFVLDEDADGGDKFTFHGGGGGGGGFGADFVAADVGEADGLEDVDPVDDPADLGFPVDGFEDAAGGGGGDDVVGDAFDLHFGAGEAGEVAGDVESDGGGHDVKMLAL